MSLVEVFWYVVFVAVFCGVGSWAWDEHGAVAGLVGASVALFVAAVAAKMLGRFGPSRQRSHSKGKHPPAHDDAQPDRMESAPSSEDPES